MLGGIEGALSDDDVPVAFVSLLLLLLLLSEVSGCEASKGRTVEASPRTPVPWVEEDDDDDDDGA